MDIAILITLTIGLILIGKKLESIEHMVADIWAKYQADTPDDY